MNFKRLLMCLVLGLAIAGFGASKKAAMVIKTQGSEFVDSEGIRKGLRTCQVLPTGVEIIVPANSKLRLSYFKNGAKETITGPCVLKVSNDGSVKIGARGSIKVEARRGSSTNLDNSKNLRRMGGSLQARIVESPEMTMARLDPELDAPMVSPSVPIPRDRGDGGGGAGAPAPPPAMPPVIPQTTPYKLVDASPVYLSPESFAPIAFLGGAPETNAVLRADESQIVHYHRLEEKAFEIAAEHLKPSQDYTLELDGGLHSAYHRFRIMSPSEREEYQTLVRELAKSEAKDPQSFYSQKLLLEMELGLLREAEKTGLKAVELFERDPGFLLALAQVKEALGRKAEAVQLVRKARDIGY